jgi:integrase
MAVAVGARHADGRKTGCRWPMIARKSGQVGPVAGANKLPSRRGERTLIVLESRLITTALKTLLETQLAEHKKLKKAGHICPNVFWRMVADERGGVKKPRAILRFEKEWKHAVEAAGCPGRIPHDLRRTAVRNLVRAGIPQTVAMSLTGHKTDSVFRRYDIVSAIDLKDAARRLDEVALMRANG